MHSIISLLAIIITIISLVSNQHTSALECYTGTSFVRGQSTSGKTEICKKASDQCLKASAEGNALTKLKLSGCSTVRCMASRDKCYNQQIAGHSVQICCCSTDLCNGKQKQNVAGNIGGIFNNLFNKGNNNNNNGNGN